MTKSRGINRPRHVWTDVEVYTLQLCYADMPAWAIARVLKLPLSAVYQKAKKLGLGKSEAFCSTAVGCAFVRESSRGKLHRFEPGHVPANKGLRRPGWSAGRMRETQFKKGTLNGRAAEIVQPIGAERISKDGYLERKINNDLPMQKRWRAVHLIVWEKANGPLPPGHVLAFKDRDKTHIALDNLELITRAERMRRNTIHNLPPEINGAIRTLAGLRRRIRKREREEQDRGSAESSIRNDRAAQR